MASNPSPKPSIDPVAARRWRRHSPAQSPWLHEEVGRRMAERLPWIRAQPQSWLDWAPASGGRQAHQAVRALYPQAQNLVSGEWPQAALQALSGSAPARWKFWARTQERLPRPDETVDLLWANMALHQEDDPPQRLAQWHALLAVDGFLMFSCFGPDTLRELRDLHRAHGWPPPTQDFVDMHDWGDLMVQTGLAEPVMDMERITLSFADAGRLLQELRELGRNLHPGRAAGLRSRAWGRHYREVLEAELPRDADGRLLLSFEIIYGHAFKAPPRVKAGPEQAISLSDMRRMLRGGGA